MIVNLSVSTIGTAVTFTYETPLRGLQDITTFVDNTTGEVPVTKFFEKQFRFAMDGVKYGPWYPLTLLELQTRIHPGGMIPLKNDLVLQFQYIRRGTDPAGVITVDDLTVGGTWSFTHLQVLDFEDTVFEDVAWTDEFFNMVWLNLMNKTYKQGIVPKFMIRSAEAEYDDDHYIVLWKSLSYYFALFIALVDNKVTHLIDNEALLAEYLRQRSLLLCGDEDISVFQDIAAKSYDEVRRRATIGIVHQDGTHLAPAVNPRHGELLRFICYDIVLDEFLFEYIKGGIYIDTNWPTYYGLTNHLQVNKAPENTQDILDLALYDISNPGGVVLAVDGTKNVAEIKGGPEYLALKETKVDSSIAYEVTFFVRANAPFSVYVEAIDEGGFVFPTQNIENGGFTNAFFTNFTPPDTTPYYFFRGIIFDDAAPFLTSPDCNLDIGSGRHLKIAEPVKRLKIKIQNESLSAGDTINIWDLKFRPLLNQQGSEFINGIDMANIWLHNNNLRYSSIDVERKISQYLLPNNAGLTVKML